MLQPILALSRSREEANTLVPREFSSARLDERVPLEPVHSMLALATERLGDAQLGLKLGRSLCFGGGGVFDYVVRSAPTVRESIGVAARYSRLLSDAFRVRLERWRGISAIRLDNEGEWPRAAGDFTMSAWYRVHAGDEVPAAARRQCWFPYAAPENVSLYQDVFPGAELKFNAPFWGIVFDPAYEDAPMPVADATLHALLCSRADAVLGGLSGSGLVHHRVRRFIEDAIRGGQEPGVDGVARLLNMSRRTLSRRLEREGTTFSFELDAVRRNLAIVQVADSDAPLTDVAFALGFSHAESFHRAFKRWTGQTPLDYRRSHTAAANQRAARVASA